MKLEKIEDKGIQDEATFVTDDGLKQKKVKLWNGHSSIDELYEIDQETVDRVMDEGLSVVLKNSSHPHYNNYLPCVITNYESRCNGRVNSIRGIFKGDCNTEFTIHSRGAYLPIEIYKIFVQGDTTGFTNVLSGELDDLLAKLEDLNSERDNIEQQIKRLTALPDVKVNGYSCVLDEEHPGSFKFGCANVSFRDIEFYYKIFNNYCGFAGCKSPTAITLGDGTFTFEQLRKLWTYIKHSEWYKKAGPRENFHYQTVSGNSRQTIKLPGGKL